MDSENNSMNSMNAAYVALSRQTAQSELIVDDKDKLMNQVSKEASNVSSLDDLKKPEEVKIENKVSDKVADEIKYFKQNNDFDKREGQFVSPQEAFNNSKVTANERDQAKSSNNEELYKEKSSKFMNEQIVARNGYSESNVEDFTKSQVETGRMTEKAAENFVENSHNNAKELEKAGILELKGNDTGEYKFTDVKSKEILFDNADKKMDDIAQKNLDAYNQSNSRIEDNADKLDDREFSALNNMDAVSKEDQKQHWNEDNQSIKSEQVQVISR